jgi:methyl-accepting chemotaxis protein
LGSGFEVVADEISRQAEHSNDLASGVSEHIQKMRGRMDSAAGKLRAFLAEGRQELDASRGQAEGALSMLLALHQRTRDSLARVTEESSHLAGDVAAAVVGLQFQDRVKQRIEHVVEALRKLEDVHESSAADLLDGVNSSYTMESERTAHQRAAGQSTSPPLEAEMEVELF